MWPQCAFYFVNFTMDTTFGVFLNWVFLGAFMLLATRFQWTSVMVTGDYGNPLRIRCVLCSSSLVPAFAVFRQNH